MNACESLVASASAGVAPALRAVDCLASETTAAAFGRLFGGGGALVPALTILLTLYIAFFAISLLTGRSRIGVAALTPRMMTLGLVLTFATSWIAYQSVVWNLAIGGPDQIASVLTGARGSATQIFADRIDIVFAAIAEVAGGSPAEGAQGAGAAAQGSFSPGNLMWLGALVLLLGTVGVLVTTRIALAVLLALGPVFVVFALFPGTRGLFAGWLRGVVLTALTPLFVVLGGSLVMELLVPVIAGLRSAEGGVDGRAALALFMIAAVHMALMVMVLRVCGTIVAAWQVFGLVGERSQEPAAAGGALVQVQTSAEAQPSIYRAQLRRADLAAPNAAAAAEPVSGPGGQGRSLTSQTIVNHLAEVPTLRGAASAQRQRARGIGSRFRPHSVRMQEIVK